MEHATKSAPDQRPGRPAAERTVPSGTAATVVDQRPEAFAQRELTEIVGGNVPSVLARQAATRDLPESPRIVAQRRQFSGMFGPLFQQDAGPDTRGNSNVQPPIQRKEETDLKAGAFNMIGETHTDYPNETFRKYESGQIKQKLGSTNRYFSEDQLKTRESDKDFSDPLDLRVEQLVEFVKQFGLGLVSSLKAIDLDLLPKPTPQNDTQSKQTAIGIVTRLIPRLTVSKPDVKSIVTELSTESPAVLNILKESTLWDEAEEIPDNDLEDHPHFSDNAIEVQVGIEYLLKQPMETKVQTKEDEEAQKAFLCFKGVDKAFETYTGRIPGTLMLYYELKSGDTYSSQGKYDFSINEIPFVLDNWNELDKLLKRVSLNLYRKDFVVLKDFIETAAVRLGNVVDGMLAGAQRNTANTLEQVIEKRSIRMHEAAQALAGSNIAWKVGDLHIKDIKKLEGSKAISETNYAYITEENFKGKNFKKEDAQVYAGSAEIADETAIKGTIDRADEMIKGHRDGLDSADQPTNASENYRHGYRQGQKQLEDEIKSTQPSRVIQRWLQKARKDNEWAKIKALCLRDGGKAAVVTAGLNRSDLEKIDPSFEGSIENWQGY